MTALERCTLGYWKTSRALLVSGQADAVPRLEAILACPDPAVARLASAAAAAIKAFDTRREMGV